MRYTQKSIEAAVPVRTAYNQWTQFESFPQFMRGVKSVKQLGARRLHWIAAIGGQFVHWTALITHQEPDRHIGWRSISGAPNAGSVSFAPAGTHGTLVTVRLGYTPAGVVERAGTALGVVERRVEADLAQFKDFIEQRGVETGAWRGAIRRGEVALLPGDGGYGGVLE